MINFFKKVEILLGFPPQPTKKQCGPHMEKVDKNSPCHPELAALLVADVKEAYKGGGSQSISGSYHLQKFSTICAQKSNVGQVCTTYNNITLDTEERSIIVSCLRHYSPRKAAFTLAEVLITLGIIGVVAAMTLPTLIANGNKQAAVTALKKNYNILNQALQLSQNDNGDYQYWENGFQMGAESYFAKYYEPYLKGIKKCTDYCGYKEQYPWKNLSGKVFAWAVQIDNLRQPYVLADGTIIVVSVGSGIQNNEEYESNNYIIVDINGTKRPNTLGKDVFMFERTISKGIQPLGYADPEDSMTVHCSKSNISIGDWCAAKIMKDNWEMKDDYPW